jgi:putative hydrolase of the HAD superfamily
VSRPSLVPPRAVLFDLDDTLLDNDRVRAALVVACGWVAEQIGGADADAVRRANLAVWRDYWPRVEQDVWLGKVEGYAVNREAWRRTLASLGVTDDDFVDRAFAHYWRVAGEATHFYDDAATLLRRLADARVPTALVTNGASDVQRDKIRLLELDRWMEVLVVSGEHGVAKPDAEVFAIALARLGVDPSEAWHVGDNLLTDVAGARNARVTAVWLDRSGAPRTEGASMADLRVTSLADLVPLLPGD